MIKCSSYILIVHNKCTQLNYIEKITEKHALK